MLAHNDIFEHVGTGAEAGAIEEDLAVDGFIVDIEIARAGGEGRQVYSLLFLCCQGHALFLGVMALLACLNEVVAGHEFTIP